jgi:arylsulfatase A-like enzyme
MRDDPVTAATEPEEPPDISTDEPALPVSRADALRAVVLAVICTSVIGCMLLSVAEFVAACLHLRQVGGMIGWPARLVLASLGELMVTHLLVLLPILAVIGLIVWVVAWRRVGRAAGLTLAGAFLLLATLVVLPADLSAAHLEGAVGLGPPVVLGLVLSGGAWLVLWGIWRRLSHRSWRTMCAAATVLALVGMGVCAVSFTFSPLANPGGYRLAAAQGPTSSHTQPHVLWIVLDTARADRMSLHGYERETTPKLDAWAEGALVFDRTIANGMWTLPSHASMFTGLPLRTHSLGHQTVRLDEHYETVAERLRDAGYATAMFSSNPIVGPASALDQGFDAVAMVPDLEKLSRCALGWLCEAWGMAPALPWLDGDNGAAATAYLVERWLSRQGNKPTFVFINYMETHLPYRAPRPYRELFMTPEQVRRSYALRRSVYGELEHHLNVEVFARGDEHIAASDRDVIRRQYDAGFRYLDDRLAELLALYARRYEPALVIITSDHGEYLGRDGMWSHPGLIYQDLIDVPLIIREPGRTGGARRQDLAQVGDLYPTVLRAVLGAEAVALPPDTVDLLAGEGAGVEPRIAVSECGGPDQLTFKRLTASPDPRIRHRAAPQIAVLDWPYKHIASADQRMELYDLERDPGETRDLSASHWKRRELQEYVAAWYERTPAYEKKGPQDDVPDAQMLEALKSLGYVDDGE